MAANIAKETFEHSHAPIVDTALEANRKIGEAMVVQGIDASQAENVWGTTLAVVAVDIPHKKFEWVQTADSLIVVIKKDGAHQMLIQDEYDHDREIMMLWKEMAEDHVDDIRSRLQNNILALRRTANVRFGTLNGNPNAEGFLRMGTMSLEDVAHILIFTDGMIPPKKDPHAPDDFAPLVNWLLQGGLPSVRDHIREIENGDPKCWEYPRYKKSDDVAAIALSFE